jgi:hypothetical protein
MAAKGIRNCRDKSRLLLNSWEVSTMARKRTTGSKSVPDAAKDQVEVKAQELIDKVLKPKHVKPTPEDHLFNYISDITFKRHGSTVFFVAVYTCPSPNAISLSFRKRFARLKPMGGGYFDVDFMRHSGPWVPLYQGLTLEQSLEAIRDDPWFIP